ncbi:hypothetical protein AV530_004600 [Patagioenas fasciata monilis]|uniref:Uncharacterized protein n=1 Tax=Patagioenas fasciata monilis TaxID=372326 RepID=A0A1V4KHM3_PATFA|nr:hypothetical protein AV530_004600 [Patagioenas fasciata monilis]
MPFRQSTWKIKRLPSSPRATGAGGASERQRCGRAAQATAAQRCFSRRVTAPTQLSSEKKWQRGVTEQPLRSEGADRQAEDGGAGPCQKRDSLARTRQVEKPQDPLRAAGAVGTKRGPLGTPGNEQRESGSARFPLEGVD